VNWAMASSILISPASPSRCRDWYGFAIGPCRGVIGVGLYPHGTRLVPVGCPMAALPASCRNSAASASPSKGTCASPAATARRTRWHRRPPVRDGQPDVKRAPRGCACAHVAPRRAEAREQVRRLRAKRRFGCTFHF
jgi:hypothetical protein